MEPKQKKRHLTVIFFGPNESGKSTVVGESFMHASKDLREICWSHVETETTRYTLLDVTGFQYLPEMISGASQADVAVLVISAPQFQTEEAQESAMLAHTLGVSKLFVVVNKMDDSSINWSGERYYEIEKEMTSFLKLSRYYMSRDVQFVPVSALLGENMKQNVCKSLCPWWNGPCLFEALDAVEVPVPDPMGPFRMPIIAKTYTGEKQCNRKVIAWGKVVSGTVTEGDEILVMPNQRYMQVKVKVLGICIEPNYKVNHAKAGENLRIELSEFDAKDVGIGCVLSSVEEPIAAVKELMAEFRLLGPPEDYDYFQSGYKATLYAHVACQSCEIVGPSLDLRTGLQVQKFLDEDAVVFCRLQLKGSVCLDQSGFGNLVSKLVLCSPSEEGRREKIIGIGKVMDPIPLNSDMSFLDSEKKHQDYYWSLHGEIFAKNQSYRMMRYL